MRGSVRDICPITAQTLWIYLRNYESTFEDLTIPCKNDLSPSDPHHQLCTCAFFIDGTIKIAEHR